MRKYSALATLATAITISLGSALAHAQEAVTRTYGSPTAVIASTASIAEGSKLVFISGTTPSPLDPAVPENLGDTRQQTLSVLTKIQTTLADMAWTWAMW